MKIRAGVRLPDDWTDDPSDQRPVVYFINGFGGDHNTARHVAEVLAVPEDLHPKPIIVVPDATCRTGHSVFTDSANNGPWGKALMEELIPEVEKRFHTKSGGAHRYVTGISSGGWSSLWLQVAYPEAFGGVWSHCPDPVDFRDFQRIDLYAPNANMYTDTEGHRRSLARNGTKVMLYYDDFCHMEQVLGDGGQIGSFEAVFSNRGPDGRPVPLFRRDTGAVDPVVAKSWEPYDIRLVLERGWTGRDGRPGLRELLKGKLHIYAGGADNFYLEGAARLLGESLRKLDSDAVVEIVDGMPHTICPDGVEAMWKTIAERESPQPGHDGDH